MKKNILLALICFTCLLISAQLVHTQWEECNNGIANNYYITFIKFRGDSIFAGTWGNGVYISTDNGESWIARNSGLNHLYIYCLEISDNNLFVGTKNGGIYYSSDLGSNWIQVNNGLTNLNVRSLCYHDETLYVATEDGFFISKDLGNKWDRKDSGISNKCIYTVAMSSNKIFVGTTIGIYMSSDNGESWTKTTSGLIETTPIVTLALRNNTIFAGVYGGIFRSTNDGINWELKNDGLSELSVNNLAVFGKNIFAATWNGICLSKNNGDMWYDIGLRYNLISSIFLDSNKIFIGTQNRGVYRSKLSNFNLTYVEESIKLVNSFQIFPNPTSNTLNIQFENEILTDLSLIKIYSGLGNEIEILNPVANGNNIQLDVSSLPQGIYYACVYSGGKVERSRFVKLIDN